MYLFSVQSPMIHNVVKWHVGCNYTHTLTRAYVRAHTQKKMKGNFLEFPWHHEFKASAVVSAIASNKNWTPKL